MLFVVLAPSGAKSGSLAAGIGKFATAFGTWVHERATLAAICATCRPRPEGSVKHTGLGTIHKRLQAWNACGDDAESCLVLSRDAVRNTVECRIH
jgi:hypothetical protein